MKENRAMGIKLEKYQKDSIKNNSIIKTGNISLVKFKILEEIEGLNHCFTTRHGGVSSGCCESLNLSFGRETSAENVKENFRRLMCAYGENEEQALFVNQNHTKKIRVIDREIDPYYGPWVFEGEEIDGLITNRKELTLFTYYGDCVPVFLYDRRTSAIGLVHSGWRGTILNAGGEGVHKLRDVYGAVPEELIAVIGPSIGPDCFLVDYGVAREFLERYGEETEVVYEDRSLDKYLVDLWEANRLNLIESGLKNENIIISGLCTSCNEELFFSHRRDQGKTGSMAALMTLK